MNELNQSQHVNELIDANLFLNAEVTYVLMGLPSKESTMSIIYLNIGLYTYINQITNCICFYYIRRSIDLPLYDIYNNAYKRGGRLNVTLDRHFIVNGTGDGILTRSILRRRTKYENRSNMSDITMQVATIVSTRTQANDRIYLRKNYSNPVLYFEFD